MITAHITIKSASGASVLDPGAQLTSETVSKYQPSAATLQKAKKLLKAAGFDVSVSGIGLTAASSVENFEKVFAIKMNRHQVRGQEIYRPDHRIQVPDDWKPIVEAIDLPEPVEYY